MPETPKTHIQIRMPGLSNKIYNVDARGRTSLPSEFRNFLKKNDLKTFYLIQFNNPDQDIHIAISPHPDGVDGIPDLTQAERDKLYDREHPMTHDNQGRINLSSLGIKNTEIKYLRRAKYLEIRPKDYKEADLLEDYLKKKATLNMSEMCVPIRNQMLKVIDIDPKKIPEETGDQEEKEEILT